ncbi:MAG TPA: type IV toxin-antitoxin system AbiEi family antitoxin [Pirellulales bacterium]|nr:type IV toxin-antitoxin system AbiEi family antitoxin [Pirellulales bacterium]
MKQPRFLQLFARNLLEHLGSETGAFRLTRSVFNAKFPARNGRMWDVAAELKCSGRSEPATLLVECRKQVSPAIAIGMLDASASVPSGASMVLFSPSISPRVAEICRQRHVSYLDAAGNCLLRAAGLYIERSGRDNVRRDTRPLRRLFSEKSSRVIRALLTEPHKGWQVQELAAVAEVSLGLASKVKQALLTQAYATKRDRLLFVRDPGALLAAWTGAYRARAEAVRLFVPGTATQAEMAVAGWLEAHSVRFALTQYSGAWRTAPMVRLSRATMWVEPLPPGVWTDFKRTTNGERVESGENIVLWQTDDPAVFDGSRPLGEPPLPTVSPLQLYLDLKLLVGRGEEAAEAIYDREIAPKFENARPRAVRGTPA